VFLNLIVNAAHAIAPIAKRSGKPGRIRIRTRHDGTHVVVAIEDSGCGNPDAIRSRIFDPFFTTKDVGASGQGLSIARSILQRHGGRIDVDSAVGAGTTFTLRIPAPADDIVRAA
jgi:signal transduction histidine kinase